MPLSDDQRALLQLLLQQGQTYDDIASLLGLDVDQVRSRARAALTEIGGEDPDRDVSLTDYLLGQADPIGRADAARQLQSNGSTRKLAQRLATQLRVLAPGAELPELPPADSTAAKRPKAKPETAAPDGEAAAAAPERRQGGGLASTLSNRQRQAIAGLVAGGVVVLIAVLAIAGAFGGGGDDDSSASTEQANRTSDGASQLTRAELSSQNGSGAQGVAILGRMRNTPVLQLNVVGLEPAERGEGYLVWLYGSDRNAYPLGGGLATQGQIRDNFPLPVVILQALQEGILDSVDVSLATSTQLQELVRRARQNPRSLPGYAGESVVRGRITGPGVSQTPG
jgi:hypothetical protein